MKRILITGLASVALIICTGCASIIQGSHKTVQISSNPSGAKFTIYNKAGKAIDSRATPASVSLDRSSGYFSKENYKVVFEMPGYYTGETYLKGSINGWYFGNLVFGGLIGLLIVDPATGAMWTLDPKELTYNLVQAQPGLNAEEIKAAQLKANPDPDAKPKEPATTDKETGS
jgi:hypothetical protein